MICMHLYQHVRFLTSLEQCMQLCLSAIARAVSYSRGVPMIRIAVLWFHSTEHSKFGITHFSFSSKAMPGFACVVICESENGRAV